MALTAQQRFDLKKHLNVDATTTYIDPLIGALEDGGVLESNVIAAITKANTKLTNKEAAEDAADELTEGEGAKFNHALNISNKRRAYNDAVKELVRLVKWDLAPSPYRGVSM